MKVVPEWKVVKSQQMQCLARAKDTANIELKGTVRFPNRSFTRHTEEVEPLY